MYFKSQFKIHILSADLIFFFEKLKFNGNFILYCCFCRRLTTAETYHDGLHGKQKNKIKEAEKLKEKHTRRLSMLGS